MKKLDTGIEGLVLLEPKVWGDARGFFMETFKESTFRDLGLPTRFAQDNFSRSSKGILRGLHFQEPNAQGKLVRCVKGSVFDVAVDIRPSSKTFGKWYGVELSEENKLALYIPEGFAHGFYVMSELADFSYKCTNEYAPKDEHGILWNDPAIGIKWPLAPGETPRLSEKDQKAATLSEIVKKLNLK